MAQFKKEISVAVAIAVGAAVVIGVISLTAFPNVVPSNPGGPAVVSESYQPCILNYSGFQVSRQFPNPSTWNFTLAEGSTGFVSYEYNVTKGLNLFLSDLKEPIGWTIWQVLPNGTNVLAQISGSSVTKVQSFIPNSNEPNVEEPPQSYTLGVQLSLVSYNVIGNRVKATWSLRGLVSGIYPVESGNLPWLNFQIVSPSAGRAVNATSESFSGSCGDSGTINS